MTDTARTLAQIKTLLADNTTKNVSPQDMRDVVESIVDPIPVTGLSKPHVDRRYMMRVGAGNVNGVTVYHVPSALEVTSLASGETYYLPVAKPSLQFGGGGSDLSGWGLSQVGTFDGSGWWGEDVPQGYYYRLPQGAYDYMATMSWELNGTGERFQTNALMDGRYVGSADPLFVDPLYASWLFLSGSAAVGRFTGIFQITDEMIADSAVGSTSGSGFAAGMYVSQTSGTPLKLKTWGLDIWRRGDCT